LIFFIVSEVYDGRSGGNSADNKGHQMLKKILFEADCAVDCRFKGISNKNKGFARE